MYLRIMVARSVEDVRAYRRCPLAYKLGGIVGEDGITSEECLQGGHGHRAQGVSQEEGHPSLKDSPR